MIAKLAYIKGENLYTFIYSYMTRNIKSNCVSANYATDVYYILVSVFSSEESEHPISVNFKEECSLNSALLIICASING